MVELISGGYSLLLDQPRVDALYDKAVVVDLPTAVDCEHRGSCTLQAKRKVLLDTALEHGQQRFLLECIEDFSTRGELIAMLSLVLQLPYSASLHFSSSCILIIYVQYITIFLQGYPT